MTLNTPNDSIIDSYLSKYISDIKSQITQEAQKYEQKELSAKLQLLSSNNDKMKKEIKKLKAEYEQLKEAKVKLLEDEVFLSEILSKFKVLRSKGSKVELIDEFSLTKSTAILSSSEVRSYFAAETSGGN